MTKNSNVNIYSVVICYHPDVKILFDICRILVQDGSKVILVDNTEISGLKENDIPVGCQLLRVGYNSGIAAAQNRGASAAISDGADILVFFDQDSQVSPGLILSLVSFLVPGQPTIVAPVCVDDVSGEIFAAVNLNNLGAPCSVGMTCDLEPYLVDIVLSSGNAMSTTAYNLIGPFDEDLFIDHVDTEWCLRCRSKEVPIYLCPSVKMSHRVGAKPISIGPFMNVLVHHHDRCYYQIRNTLLIMRKSYVPCLFALKELISISISRLLLLFFVDHKVKYFFSYVEGVIDGIFGVVGARRK